MTGLQPSISLLGVMTADEVRTHLSEVAGPDEYSSEDALTLWRSSHDALAPVHTAPGLPEIQEFPATAWEHLLQLHRHESFPAITAGFRWSSRLIEIDPLLSIAIDLSEDRLRHWGELLSGADLQRAAELCLPQQAAPLTVNASPTHAFVVHTDLGAHWAFNPQTFTPTMTRPPLPVRAAEIAGRLYLIDGYHRAVAMRRLGSRFIPCMILHDCNWTVLRTTPRRRRFEPPAFARPTPPCAGHFLSPAAVPTRTAREVRVMTMHLDSFISPLATL